MHIGKLFKVLVIGGSLLAAGCTDGDDEPPIPDGSTANIPNPDGDGGASHDATNEQPDATAGLEECGFCPNEACCEYDEAGNGSEKEGFVCCWSTTC